MCVCVRARTHALEITYDGDRIVIVLLMRSRLTLPFANNPISPPEHLSFPSLLFCVYVCACVCVCVRACD